MRTSLAGLLATIGCAGAEPSEPPIGCEGVAPTITLGTGRYAYEPLVDGDPVVLAYGPQGGWHVWTSGQVTGPGPEVTLHSTLEAPGFEQSLAGSNDLPWAVDLSDPATGTWDAETCSGEFYGQYTYVDDAVPPNGSSYLDFICGIEGKELAFGVTLTPADSATEATDSRKVRGQLDPVNVAYCHGQ